MYSSIRLQSPAPAWRLNLSSCVSEYNYIPRNVSLNNYTTCLRMPLRQSVKETKQKTGKICDIRNKTQKTKNKTRWNRHWGVGCEVGVAGGGWGVGVSLPALVQPSGLDQSQQTPASTALGHHLPCQGKPRPAQLLDIICHSKANPGQHSS